MTQPNQSDMPDWRKLNWVTEPEQSASDLTEVDRAILRELEGVHGEGSVLGADLAVLVGVPGRSIGSRLSALVNRGLVMGHRVGGHTAWALTLRGSQEGPW